MFPDAASAGAESDQPTMVGRPSHLLEVESIATGYGKRTVLNRVSLELRPNEIVALIGHNGAGKSTLLKAIFGVLPIWRGGITYYGERRAPVEPRELLRLGIVFVQQGHGVFARLTVQENLEIAGISVRHGKRRLLNRIDAAIAQFPVLKHRLGQRAGTLSGGEQQMLSLAMGLVPSPKVMLLDEPTLGLSPALATRALRQVQELRRDHGVSILVVEQKVRDVLRIADRVIVLRMGEVVFCGSANDLRNDDAKLRKIYL